MNDVENNLDAEIRIWQENLLKRSIRRTRKLGLLMEMVGKSSSNQCLQSGGSWAVVYCWVGRQRGSRLILRGVRRLGTVMTGSQEVGIHARMRDGAWACKSPGGFSLASPAGIKSLHNSYATL